MEDSFLQVSKKNNNSLSKLSSQIICHFQIFEQCAYYIISHNLLDSEQRQRYWRRRTKAQHVAIFPPARFSQLRVQCFFLALKKGSNNLASGSIFCSPSIFYYRRRRQFLSTCASRDRKSYQNQPTLMEFIMKILSSMGFFR